MASAESLRVFHAAFVHWHYRVATYNELAKRVAAFHVVCVEEDPTAETAHKPSGYDLEYRAGGRLSGYRLMWQACLPAVFRLNSYDIYLLEWNVRNVRLWSDTLLLRCMRKKVVWWGHGVSKRNKLLSRLLVLVSRVFASGFLVYTQAGKDILVDRFNYKAGRVFVAPNGVPVERQPPRVAREEALGDLGVRLQSLSDERRHFATVYCGRLEPGRDLERIIEAMAKIADRLPQWYHFFVGTGSDEAALKGLVESKGLSARVLFFGARFDSKFLTAVYSVADVAIIPGWLGLALTQAGSYGCPAIIGNNATLHNPEIAVFREGQTGWTYNYEVNDLDAAILRVAEHAPKLLKAAGKAAHSVVYSEYSTEAMVNGITQSLAEV